MKAFSRLFSSLILFISAYYSTDLFSAPSIFESIQQGNLQAVKQWVLAKKDFDVQFQEKTVLQYAIEKNQTQITFYLIQNKIALNNESIVSAIKTKQIQVVQALIQSGIQLRGNLVYEAAKVNSMEILTLILKQNLDVNETDPYGRQTALHYAVSHENIPMIKLLLQHQANVNIKNYNWSSPFHLAACRQNKEILEILLQNKADIKLLDANGNSAIHFAASFSNPEIINWLITHGFSVQEKNKYGTKPIHFAALQDKLDNFKHLISLGADMQEKNMDGETPIYLAYRFKFNGKVKNYLTTLGYNYDISQIDSYYKLDLKKAKADEEEEKQRQKSIQAEEKFNQIFFGYVLPTTYLALSIYSREKSYKNNPEENPFGLINGFSSCLLLGGLLGAGIGMNSKSGSAKYSEAVNIFIGSAIGIILGGTIAFLTAKETNKNSVHYYSATGVLVLFPVIIVNW